MDKVLHNYFITWIKNAVANAINATHDGKVTRNTVDYTTAFLCSDWLYFQWHGIIVNYTIASVWRESMPGYLSLDIICSGKPTVVRERRSRNTVSLGEQIMSNDKYPSIFSRQTEAVEFIILQTFFATRTVFGECHKDILQFLSEHIQSRDAFSPIARERKFLINYKSIYTMLYK